MRSAAARAQRRAWQRAAPARPRLALRTAAESLRCLSLCGASMSSIRRARLMTAAARLPLLRQAQVRVAVAGIDTEVRRIASRIGALSLVDEGERPSATIDALERSAADRPRRGG